MSLLLIKLLLAMCDRVEKRQIEFGVFLALWHLERCRSTVGGGNGNYVLSNFSVAIPSANDKDLDEVPISDASASYEESGWTIDRSVDRIPNTAWATAPHHLQPQSATFQLGRTLAANERVRITVECQHPRWQEGGWAKGFNIGRFRISVR